MIDEILKNYKNAISLIDMSNSTQASIEILNAKRNIIKSELYVMTSKKKKIIIFTSQ